MSFIELFDKIIGWLPPIATFLTFLVDHIKKILENFSRKQSELDVNLRPWTDEQLPLNDYKSNKIRKRYDWRVVSVLALNSFALTYLSFQIRKVIPIYISLTLELLFLGGLFIYLIRRYIPSKLGEDLLPFQFNRRGALPTRIYVDSLKISVTSSQGRKYVIEKTIAVIKKMKGKVLEQKNDIYGEFQDSLFKSGGKMKITIRKSPVSQDIYHLAITYNSNRNNHLQKSKDLYKFMDLLREK